MPTNALSYRAETARLLLIAPAGHRDALDLAEQAEILAEVQLPYSNADEVLSGEHRGQSVQSAIHAEVCRLTRHWMHVRVSHRLTRPWWRLFRLTRVAVLTPREARRG